MNALEKQQGAYMKQFYLAAIILFLLLGCASTGRSKSIYVTLEEANKAFEKKDYTEASKKYLEYLSKEKDKGIEEKLIFLMINSKDYSGIIKIAEKYTKPGSEDIQFMFYHADALYALGAKEKALGIYSKILLPKQYSFENFFKFANENFQNGKHEIALYAYNSCILINPQDVMSHNNRAYVLFALKRNLDQAILDIEFPIKAYASDPWCRRMAGHIWYEVGNFQKAFQNYNDGLVVYTDQSEYGTNGQKTGKIELLMGVARSAVKLGKIEEAKSFYLEAKNLGSTEASKELSALQ